MRNNLRTILFVASIALNVAFTATYISYKLPLLTAKDQQKSSREPLFLQVDMTADQFARLNAERHTFHAQLQKPGQDIMEKQTELIDLLAAAPADRQAIAKKQEEIHDLQGVFQIRIIDHFLRASSILSPAQRTRFFELIKTRIETSGPSLPALDTAIRAGQKRRVEE